MTKNTAIGIAIAVVIIIIAAIWYVAFRGGQGLNTPLPTPQILPTEEAAPTATNGAKLPPPIITDKATVQISGVGFLSELVVISIGGKVTWKNIDTKDHQIASDPHPTHTDYPSLNLGVIKPGEEKTLTLDKVGIYKYHDHLNPSFQGTIQVQ
ncbi:hypothetical protein A2Z23_00065 [Candidatus Curtissbacteria bacterium RBG_16_39_7]|uniref:EfeO-type cupredoxin-like domain-containing protein n=1 Tax=Candidatus Curtissbacteria bacterium RBG_16_39_7 TaxID=1797707 RepID=A0A1F5G1B3_9BACT|nr:MAG: hypothetical protein A2Z23_00065 [Candidatus Curtissbacteria bacterium RBG_16_39_7]